MDIISLEELCVDIIDCPHSSPIWQKYGVPVIRNYNLQDGRINLSKLSYVDSDTYEQRIKRAKPEEGDIVISREAPMGVVGIVPSNLKCCLGQRLVLLKIDKNKCDPVYLLYALLSDYVQIQIKRINQTGSIVSNLNIPDLKLLKIPLLKNNKSEVSKILSNLDKQIDINLQENNEIENMIKTVYNYWFLQYKYSNFNNNENKSFENSVKWSNELKKYIPCNWKVVALSEIVNENIKSNVKVNEAITEGEFPFYTSGETISNHNEYFVDSFNLFLNTGGNAGVSCYYGKSAYSTDTWCITGIDNYKTYLYQYLSSISKNLNINFFAGTGLKHLQKKLLLDHKILLPSEDIMKEFEEFALIGYKKISHNINENNELIRMKKFLLPLLMTGKIKFYE